MAKTTLTRVPFNGVDGLMQALDEPGRPQTIEFEVAVDAALDRARLADAVRTAADLHPMARARQVRPKPTDSNYSWEITEKFDNDPVVFAEVSGAEEVDKRRDAFFSRHVGVDRSPPFRVLHVSDPAGDRVMLSVNHTAFDGIGTYRFLQSISRAYAGEADPLPEIDALAARRNIEKQRPARRTLGGGGLGGSPTDMFQGLSRLAPATSEGRPGFSVLHLDMAAADASAPGATVNDVLVAALHRTVQAWNDTQGSPTRRVSVMMPVNQRPGPWRGEVLGNFVVPGKVVSSAGDRSNPRRLLKSVTAQTKSIKTDGVPGAAGVLRPMNVPVLMRGVIPHVIDAVSDRSADTAVMSNLGRAESPPWFGAQGRGLWFSPPPRVPVILTVGAATTDDRLWISLRSWRPALAPADSRRLADLFLIAIGDLHAGGASELTDAWTD